LTVAAIIAALLSGALSAAQAIAILAGEGITVPAAIVAGGVTVLVNYLTNLSTGGTGTNVACVTTHSSKVQGAGLCCQAVQSGALIAPPAGTILPQYTPGSARNLPAGRITAVTDAQGHCGSCMIVGSSSKKHPGAPALKFIRGGPQCPSSTQGCCALNSPA
jgi:hypothetical protein